jgi:hypothetical protein
MMPAALRSPAAHWRLAPQLLLLLLLLARAQDNFTADFGGEVVGSATDINEAAALHDAEEARSMESLLHWAICE